MPKNDNIYYYVAYGLILLAFYFVLKSPKKSKDKNKDEEK
jgi:hypothetical protein